MKTCLKVLGGVYVGITTLMTLCAVAVVPYVNAEKLNEDWKKYFGNN